MSDSTPHLGLPLIAASQAQKHVTHNEALGLLDALVQLACLDKDLTAPPASPAEGDRYLVVTSNPGGAWAGLAGQVVRYADGVWTGAVPRAGWLAYVMDEADLYVFDGAAWTSLRRTLTGIQSVSRLGINTDADGTNRLAVKADAALLSWDDVTPGSGNMRVTVNKKAAANDAGFVFQTGWSSRALFGTLGGDDFVLKTSPDGAAFVTALTAAAATGVVAFAKSPTAPTPAPGDASTQLATTAFVAARGLAFRNRLVNGAFAINQRNASGSQSTYNADVYIVDRWKAGANGVTLSFATAANRDATVTITAGSLVQVIEGGLHLPEGGSYTLSWQGTASGRVYPRGASSPPAYAASGTLGTLAAGSDAVVEFTAGTVGLAQLEPGGTATAFERRDDELRRCQRYCTLLRPSTGRLYYPPAHYADADQIGFAIDFLQLLRAPPQVQLLGTPNAAYCVAYNGGDQTGFTFVVSSEITERAAHIFAKKVNHGLPINPLVEFDIKPTGGLLLSAEI